MKLRSGRTIAPKAPKPLKTDYPIEIDDRTVVLYENGKRFRISSQRDWCLIFYKPSQMMLITHSPCTGVDYFENSPVKITYNDSDMTMSIGRPVTSYKFEFKSEAEYNLIKSLDLEKHFNTV